MRGRYNRFLQCERLKTVRATAILLSVSISFLFSSCQKPDDNGQEPDPAPGTVIQIDRTLLYGTWDVMKAKYAPDAVLTDWEHEYTCATFKENGLYEGKGYYGNGEGIYTIENNIIKVLIGNELYVSYEVLSLEEETATLCATFTSIPSKVWMECQKHHEQEPGGDPGKIDMYSFFLNASDVERYINGLYEYLSEFVSSQLSVERLLLSNDRSNLQPNSKSVSDLWTKGYKTIRLANQIIVGIRHWDDKTVNYDKSCYLPHAFVVRAFVLYNMNHLWGGIPIVMEDMADEDAGSLSRSSEKDVYQFVINEIRDERGKFTADSYAKDNYLFTEPSAIMLLTEVFLASGNYPNAEVAIQTISPGTTEELFTILHSETGINGDVNTTKIPIYSKTKLDLYQKEAKRELSGLADAWQAAFGGQYGHWAALRRMGVAQTIVGCETFQLLLPIPLSALEGNPNMVQNPGY